MRGLVERAVDLWTFGLPVVLVVWSLLRLAPRAPARARYLLVVAAFPAVLLLPLFPSSSAAASVAPAAEVGVPIVWIAGALLLLARDVIGHARLRRERYTDAPPELRALLEWPSDVPLAIGSAVPMTIGLLRPRVVLPADPDLPIDVLRRITMHELSHARWRDPLVYAVLRMIAAVFWMSPLWLLLRWARREREAAADEAALRDARGEEASYVAALLRLSDSGRRYATGIAGSDLAYRARRILAPRRVSRLAFVTLIAGIALVMCARPLELDDRIVVIRRVEVIR